MSRYYDPSSKQARHAFLKRQGRLAGARRPKYRRGVDWQTIGLSLLVGMILGYSLTM